MVSKLHKIYPKSVTIVDQPCGYGKTTKMIQSLNAEELFLVVVPLKSEVRRVLESVASLGFEEPLEVMTDDRTKRSALVHLVNQRKSIVTTHKLYSEIGYLCSMGLLDEYKIIIDEVPEAVTAVATISKRSAEEFYLRTGYLSVDDNGLCSTTPKWEEKKNEVSDTLNPKIMASAEGGNLYLTPQGTFIMALPEMLFYRCSSLTVLTYMSEGSYFRKYMDRIGVRYDVLHSEEHETTFKEKARNLITFADASVLENVNFTYNKQMEVKEGSKICKKVCSALKNLRQRQFRGTPLTDIMVTSAEKNWRDQKAHKKGQLKLQGYAKSTGLGRVHWVANQTRGTNDYVNCSHIVYLYDKHPQPPIAQWLNASTKAFSEAFALTELIQWVWRSRIRQSEPITLYLPSPRMKRLLLDWLNT